MNEDRGNREYGQEMLAGLTGRVMEVGPGNGLNFPHYPVSVQEVVAVEPEPYLRSRAVEAAAAAPVPIRVADGSADELPAPDGSFDAVVVSGLLCSVADPSGRSPSSTGCCGRAVGCDSTSTSAAGTSCSLGTSGAPTWSGR